MSPEFRKKIKNVLFIDIETIAAYPAYEQMPERLQQLWDKRADVIRKRAELESWGKQDLYHEQAGISAEFGRIACIAFGGAFFNAKDEPALRVTSFGDDKGQDILPDFNIVPRGYS